MALIFMEGFDHLASADLYKKWTGGGSFTIDAGNGRRGGAGARPASSAGNVYKDFTGAATIIFGFAFYNSQNAVNVCNVWEAGIGQHLTVLLNSSNKIEVRRGSNGGTLLGTSTASVSPSTYSYLEFKVTCSDTVGVVQVRINGALDINLSSQDTRNQSGGSSVYSRVYLGYDGNLSAGGNNYYDDFYLCDSTGSTMNDFLGDVRIDTLVPNADGTYSQYTPSTGTSHYQLVDETTPNTTDYNESNTVGHRDSYGMTNLPSLTGSILAVQTNVFAWKADSGYRQMKTLVRSGSTDQVTAVKVLGTGSTYYSDLWLTDPSTGIAWTESTVNAMEVGTEVA